VLYNIFTEDDMLDVHKHYDLLSEDKVMLSYRGRVNGDLITSLLQFAEAKFSELQTAPVIRKKLINILVETLQNIFHHGRNPHDSTHPDDSSLLMITREEDGYLVITGNHVSAAKAQAMKLRLDRINAMSKEELSMNYRHILSTKEKAPDTAGAGIGMIDIARRSGKKIEYSMRSIDDDCYFFCMQIKIVE
jgi:hypothetical protein